MTYFSTTYRQANPRLNIDISTGTAIYVGPNPPPQQGGTPLAFTPPASGQELGTATLPCFTFSPTGEPTASTFEVQMSQDEANTLGNSLWTAHLEASQTVVNGFTGGVVAV